jgi:hypothetical protein
MPAPVTDAQARAALAAVIAHGSLRSAARALGMPHSTLQSHVDRARARWPDEWEAAKEAAAATSKPAQAADRRAAKPAPKPAPAADRRAAKPAPKPAPTLNENVELTGLRARSLQLQAQLKEAHRELDSRGATIRAYLGLRNDTPKSPAWASPRVATDSPGVPIFLWSDWHVGETVDPLQVYGVNAYDAAITDARIERLVRRSIFLAKKRERWNDCGGAVIMLDGDFVSGWQHEELVATDWCTPLQAVRFVSSRLVWALERMRETFGKLHIICTPGNHGRLNRRPPAKIAAYSAYDWLIYGFLADTLGKKSGYTFIIPGEGDHVVTVAGTRYLVMHGHELGVKGGDGLIGAIGPIMRGRQKSGRSNASLGRDFDVLVLGHFHQSLWLPGQGLIVNNTSKGYDEYAKREKYVATTPSQTMWWSSPKFGPTMPVEVFVEDPRALAGLTNTKIGAA